MYLQYDNYTFAWHCVDIRPLHSRPTSPNMGFISFYQLSVGWVFPITRFRSQLRVSSGMKLLDLGKSIQHDHEIYRMSPSNQTVNKNQYKGLFHGCGYSVCADPTQLFPMYHSGYTVTVQAFGAWWNSAQHHCLSGDFTRNNIGRTT